MLDIREIKSSKAKQRLEIKIDGWWIEMSETEIAAYYQIQSDIEKIRAFQREQLNKINSPSDVTKFIQTIIKKYPQASPSDIKKFMEKMKKASDNYHQNLTIKGLYHHIINQCASDNQKNIFDEIRKFLLKKSQGKKYRSKESSGFRYFYRRILHLADDTSEDISCEKSDVCRYLPDGYEISRETALELLNLLPENRQDFFAIQKIYHNEIRTSYKELCKQAHEVIPLLIASEHYNVLQHMLVDTLGLFFNIKSTK